MVDLNNVFNDPEVIERIEEAEMQIDELESRVNLLKSQLIEEVRVNRGLTDALENILHEVGSCLEVAIRQDGCLMSVEVKGK